MPTPFVHLHNHSEFSLLDGATKIKDMVKYAVDNEMPAIALTDHGMMYGAMEFYMKARAAGVKPLIGCCLPGQRIHTENGVKPIEQIRVGEKVLTHTGAYKPVLRTMTREYEGTIYGVQATNSHEVWLTDEHPIRVRDGKTGELQWVRADELTAGYRAKGRRGAKNWLTYACLPKIKASDTPAVLCLADYVDKYDFPESDGQIRGRATNLVKHHSTHPRPLPAQIAVTADLMRLFGLYIAEGSSFGVGTTRNGVCWTFCMDESHYADFVVKTVAEVFGLPCSTYIRVDKNIIEVKCNNRIMAVLFEALFGKGARNKRIPAFAYTLGNPLKSALLYGIADGDARYHASGQIALKMSSENVVYGAKLLAASLGFSGGVQHQTTAAGQQHYLFTWNPEASFRKYLQDDANLYLPIKEVLVRPYCGPVFNIEVEGDHSYVTDFALHNCELYVATRKRTDRDPKKDGNHHLVALAKNEAGYKNLMRLATKASLEGFYYKPRVDKDLLAEHSEGLIICSACMGGELAKTISSPQGGYQAAKDVAAWYREIWGDDFYLEIQGHGATGQDDLNAEIKRISREMGIKMVATNDAHYLQASDADAHDVLICIQTGTNVNDNSRMKYEPRAFYLKSYEEMVGKFEHFAPDAIENTVEIADKCNLEIEMGRVGMPAVDLPAGKSPHEYMTDLCREGLTRRIKNVSNVHHDRLTYELGIIEQTGFSQYFLIVMDISNHARQSGIFFGVRGSAAGSLASYCLGITDLDPIEYNLTFERFLNPERITMPDVDMDFQDDRRAEVIKHVTEKYGQDNVAFITTFGTMGAKAALRDAGRALALPMPDVDRWAKMVPTLPVGITIERAMHDNPDFAAEYANNPEAKRLIDTAQRLEGISRHASVHAAGIMIADKPLVNYTPLARTADGSLVTQYPHSSLEAIGLLKMDFLGLSNLTILARAVKLIKQTRDEDIDVWDIPLGDDPRAARAYDMLARGETTGVFQLESQGMRKYVIDLKPNSVKELAAMVALYRPGPMSHIPRFIRCKFDPTEIEYTHPLLEPILEETYGVIVYQDQVLKIVQAVAGFTLGQADLLRRAMGKKKLSEMEKQRENFIKGAATKGVSKKIAEQIFNEIEPFAGYAFNGCLHAKTQVHTPDGRCLHISRAYAEQTPELMAMWEDGVIRPHQVARIVKTGRKPLFTLRTAGKRVVRATAQHRFLTTEGYKRVDEMEVGTELIVQPRPVTGRQREARRRTMGAFQQTPAQRERTSQRMQAYQAARPLSDKVAHMKQMHTIYPDLWRKGQEAATAQAANLHENDPVWRQEFLAKSLANVRATYDTGPGYGHCSIASNGMWCASAPERAMCEWLIEQDIEFVMHKVLPNGRICDFYFAGIYWEMDGMDRTDAYFAHKYGDLPYVVVTPEDFRPIVTRHLELAHAENGDPIISIEYWGEGETYDIEMAEGGPKNFIANRIVSHNSHAACYAMVAYQTAYLKANYPAEYLAALMGTYIDNTEKVVATIEECGRLGVKVLPPDINESASDFTVHGTDTIRFGLLAIKNVGKAPIEAILTAREKAGRFTSMEDFCTRVFPEGLTSKSVIEMLVKAATFNSIETNRRWLIEQVDECCQVAQRGARDAKAGLISLFGDAPAEDAADTKAVTPAPTIPDFPRGELLAMEKELLGLYLSEHPVKPFEAQMRNKYRALRCDGLKETAPDQEVTVGGILSQVRTHYTKKGEPMLFLTLEDSTGSVSATCFPSATREFASLLIKDAVVVIKGKAQHRERILSGKAAAAAQNGADAEGGNDKAGQQVELLVDRVTQIVPNAMSADARPRTVHIRIGENNRTLINMIKSTLTSRKGGCQLFLHVETGGGIYKIKPKEPDYVDDNEEMLGQLRQMLGGGKLVWVE